MDLTHSFTVPTPVAETWEHFSDIGAVAECFPGATLTSVEGDTFNGSVKVKLGPIALVYNGTGTFVEKNEDTRTFLIEAKGKDKRGNGTAGANVTVSMKDADGGGTAVDVVTDLAITGKPAQFGRGVMQDVSDKLLAQFVACLEQRLGSEESAHTPGADSSESASAAGEAAHDEPTPVAAAAAAAAARTAQTPAGATGASTSGASTSGASTSGSGQGGSDRSAPQQDEALDLGATVLPVLVKSYGKQLAGGLLAVLVLALLIRRWRRD